MTVQKLVCSTMPFLRYMGATSISEFGKLCQRVVSIQPSWLTTKNRQMYSTPLPSQYYLQKLIS